MRSFDRDAAFKKKVVRVFFHNLLHVSVISDHYQVFIPEYVILQWPARK
jgi:hypothetical protein